MILPRIAIPCVRDCTNDFVQFLDAYLDTSSKTSRSCVLTLTVLHKNWQTQCRIFVVLIITVIVPASREPVSERPALSKRCRTFDYERHVHHKD